MTDTLTKTEKKTTRRTVEKDYTIYRYPKAKVVLARVVTKDTDVKKGQAVTAWYLFSQTTYDKYQHRKAWTWIVNLGLDDLFAVMTTGYMKHYLDGCAHRYPDDKPKHVAASGWKKVLDTGDYSRVAIDKTWYDGMMYGPQGKPIRRAFRFDYINGGVGSNSYDVVKVEEWLKRQTSVRDVECIQVPYYSEDSCGSRAVEFTFQPSLGTFLLMRDKGALHGFELNEFVRKRLGIAKFKFQIPER